MVVGGGTWTALFGQRRRGNGEDGGRRVRRFRGISLLGIRIFAGGENSGEVFLSVD